MNNTPKMQRGSVSSLLSLSSRQRIDSLASSTSTHRGGSLHIAGFGEAHDFRIDNDYDARYGKINNTNTNASNSLMESERNDLLKSDMQRSSSMDELNNSRDSQGRPLTDKQSRIQAKMKKKLEQKKKIKERMKQQRNEQGITNPDQQCCHDKECTIF